jgi:hypothetical protein
MIKRDPGINLMCNVIDICDQIVSAAEAIKEIGHPDPVARIHSVAMLVDGELMRRMKALSEEKK